MKTQPLVLTVEMFENLKDKSGPSHNKSPPTEPLWLIGDGAQGQNGLFGMCDALDANPEGKEKQQATYNGLHGFCFVF